MTVLYVMNEHPSVAETFVVNEASSVARQGVDVVAYALKLGKADRPAAEVQLVARPATRADLMRAALSHPRETIIAMWRDQWWRLSPKEVPRLLLAHLHATRLAHHPSLQELSHVHAHFLGRASDVARILAGRRGCTWTATAHASDAYAPKEIGLLRKRLDTVSEVACANMGVRDSLIRREPSLIERTPIVHCGVALRQMGEPQGSAPAEAEVVTVGRLVPTKGFRTIVAALPAVLAARPWVKWKIIGDGPLREELGAHPNVIEFGTQVTFTGAAPHQEAVAAIARSAVFVLPCELGADGTSDGIPVALMEAMAAGVPVITTPVGGIGELVKDRKTGYLVPPQDAEALVSRLCAVLDGPGSDEVNAIREAGRALVQQEFNLDAEAGKMVEMFSRYIRR